MTWNNHPNVDEILRVPGYLFWGTTALTSEATWGTKLGFTETGIRLEFLPRYIYHRIEEDGSEPSIKLYGGTFCRIYCTLKNFNTTAINAIFPGLSGDNKIVFPGTIKTGRDITGLSTNRLLFVPDDRDSNPICLAQKASGLPVQAFYFKRDWDTLFESAFDCFRKTGDEDGIVYVGDIDGGTLR